MQITIREAKRHKSEGQGTIPRADSEFLTQNYVIYKFHSMMIFTSVSTELNNLSTVSMLPRSINGITLHGINKWTVQKLNYLERTHLALVDIAIKNWRHEKSPNEKSPNEKSPNLENTAQSDPGSPPEAKGIENIVLDRVPSHAI